MIEWKSIDTAPRDGSEFLAFDPVAKKFDVCIMSKLTEASDVWYCWSVQLDGEYGQLDDEFNGDRATIWAPLPKLNEQGMPRVV